MADLMAQARAALHLDVACPRCRAPFSSPCRTSAGNVVVQVHSERELASRQLARGQRWTQEEMFAGG